MSDPRYLPYLLLLPAILFLAVFFLFPVVQVLWEAFTANGTFSLRNFETMSNDWKFQPALLNTILLTVIIVPIQVAFALTMASLVTSVTRGRDFALYIFTIPLGISDLAAGLIWLAILNQSGFLNSFFYALGVIDGPIVWLSFQNWGLLLAAIVLAEVWRATAIILVILVAGMGLIPREYYEAAEVFGAGPWKRFTKVTLPLLKPSLQTALILRTILALEVFAVVMALAGTNFPVLMSETFNWQFQLQDRKVAAAYAVVILGISAAFTLLILKTVRVRDEVKA
jgi:multiple sugar transport system permease protein